MSADPMPDARALRLGFVGAGRAASALALGLADAGCTVWRVASLHGDSARALAARITGCQAVGGEEVARTCDLVFVAVPDGQIGTVAAQLPWREGSLVAHCSGALGAEMLAPASTAGAIVGSFHPLQTLADVQDGWRNLPGSTFAVEGEPRIVAVLEELARALHGRVVHIPSGRKPLYHASAVLVSNAVVALMDAAAGLWSHFGESKEDAAEALLPLLAGTISNLEQLGPRGALTGPISRGDEGTVAGHLAALNAAAPDLLDLYRELGLATMRLAHANGQIGAEQTDRLRELLAGAHHSSTASARPLTNDDAQRRQDVTSRNSVPAPREERACV